MNWSSGNITDAVTAGLARRAKHDDMAQVVYGLDALDELELHPLIQVALQQAGYGTWPEQRYPDDDRQGRRNEGKRCDLVLTPDGRPLRDNVLKTTLFDTPAAIDPDEAYWLEIKTVAHSGIDGPSSRYAAELLGPVVEDARKLLADTVICHAGLLLILFTTGKEIAKHDLVAWNAHCVGQALPVDPPATRHFSITDRTGNSCCSVALFHVCGH